MCGAFSRGWSLSRRERDFFLVLVAPGPTFAAMPCVPPEAANSLFAL